MSRRDEAIGEECSQTAPGIRFAIIDPSIKSLVGHHLTYAIHVLEAARQAGLLPVVGTHRELEPAAAQELKAHFGGAVLPVFRHEHWKRVHEFPGVQLLTRWGGACHRVFVAGLLDGTTRRVYALIGALRRRLEPERIYSQPLSSCLLILSLLLPALICAPLGLLYWLTPPAIRPLRLLRLFIRAVEYCLWECVHYRMSWVKRVHFSEDCRRFIREAGLKPGDIVFVPTLSFDELRGLGDLLQRDAHAGELCWHLVFRYNIFLGREPDFWRQKRLSRKVERDFQNFAAKTQGKSIHFWTDTVELSIQYNAVSPVQFRELPIPHTHETGSDACKPATGVTAVYAGDARTDKGYIALPRIVDVLRDGYLQTGKLRFRIQSNYNLPGGEPRVVSARARLGQNSPEAVELIDRPLNEVDYRALLQGADVVLLLYDPLSYSARSSGILAEALTAGVPVLASAGTWLAEQLRPAVQAYWRTLLDSSDFRDTLDANHPQGGGITQPIPVHDVLSVPSLFSSPWTVTLNVLPETQAVLFAGTPEVRVPGLALRLHFAFHEAEGELVQQYSRWVGPFRQAEEELALVMVPDRAVSVTITLFNVEHDCPIAFRNWRIEQCGWQGRSRGETPASAVGMVCASLADAPFDLAEIVEHLPHYRRTAAEFATRFFEFHNAPRLIEILRAAGSH